MAHHILPQTTPAARLVLEVLLGPRAEIMVIHVEVRDPDGRLLALRALPGSVKLTTAQQLDAAWEELLRCMPPRSWTAHYDHE